MDRITVKTHLQAPIEKIWEYWTSPEHIKRWNHASADWHSPRVINKVVVGEKFIIRMESVDGTEGFDFEGTYTAVEPNKKIEYVMSDNRKVQVLFQKEGDGYTIIETADPEHQHTLEVQQAGWQAILDNFKVHVTMHL